MSRRDRVIAVILTLVGWLTIFGGVCGIWAASRETDIKRHLMKTGAMLVVIAIGVAIARVALRMQPEDSEDEHQ